MIKKTVLALFLFAGLTAFFASESNAQCHSGFNPVITGNRVIAPRPPYFAIHPPVYYDRIVRRAYGMSPYAVPPGVMPVENTVAEPPKAVSNPYFKGPKPAKSRQESKSKAKTVNYENQKPKAKFIANPYCSQKVASAS